MKHSRQSTRLRNFDYTQAGAYFITIVTYQRRCLFGNIIDDQMECTFYGNIARAEWLQSSKIRDEIELFEDEFVVMPNHIHGIVWITTGKRNHCVELNLANINPNLGVGATGRSPLRDDHEYRSGPLPKSLGAFVAGYKAPVTKQVNILQNTPGSPLWMRNYHDRIIRNDRELKALREYIHDNPLRWELDHENPKHIDTIHHP